MNADTFKGGWHQFKGDLKSRWGQLTDDDIMQIDGDMEKFEGIVQQRYGEKKDEVLKWADQWKPKEHATAGRRRPGT
jgi:uncharacterized protein YjbJ (UPF0337 family)